MKSRQLIVYLLLLLAAPVQADSYLVVGSFSDQDKAEREMARINAGLGESAAVQPGEFEVDGSRYIRLLVPVGEREFALRTQLQAMGLSYWILRSESTLAEADLPRIKPVNAGAISSATPTKPEKHFYVVVGAYADINDALDLESKLSNDYERVKGEAVLSNGKVLHRVLIGPMPKHQLADIQASLAARGLDDSWRLEAIVDSEVASVVGGSTLAPTTATKTPVLSAADEAATKRRTDMPTRGEDKQYPQNFNLAKMPPKRTGLPIVE